MSNLIGSTMGKAVDSPAKKAARQRGITLIELMIVIGIIGILVAIAAPSYSSYVKTARRAEAQQTLLKAAAELEKLYGRQGKYTGAVFTDDVSNLNNDEFRIGPSVSEDENGMPGDYLMTFSELTAGTYRITATAGEGGQQATDNECLTMSYDNAGQKYRNGAVDINGTCW